MAGACLHAAFLYEQERTEQMACCPMSQTEINPATPEDSPVFHF